MNKNRPIGVFDSGIGGLTVAKELLRILPNEKIIYFGDTARVPYGTKSKATVTKFSIENVLFLLGLNVKLIVIACNTVSSLALPTLKKFIRVPMVDVIGPGVKDAVKATENKRIAVIGTRATILSKEYPRQINLLDDTVRTFSASCPLFVPLAEEGWFNNRIVFEIAKSYLNPIKKRRVDTIILGCTHYPLLKNIIKRVLGKDVQLIDSAKSVAYQTKRLLIKEDLLNTKVSSNPMHRFYVSDEPQRFKRMGERFLGRKIDSVKKVTIGQ